MESKQIGKSNYERLCDYAGDAIKLIENNGGYLSPLLSASGVPVSAVTTIPSLEESSKMASVWDDCSTQLLDCFETRKIFPCIKALSLCSGAENLLKQLFNKASALDQMSQGLEVVTTSTKESIYTLSSHVFKSMYESLQVYDYKLLPAIPTITQPFLELPLDLTAVAAIATTAVLQPLAIKRWYQADTQLAVTINKGLLTGATMAWAFDQNLYVGACAGVTSALPIDFILSYTLSPSIKVLGTVYDYAQAGLIKHENLAKYCALIPVLSFCYSQVGGLVSFSDNSPLYSGLPFLTVLFATGTAVFALKYPIGLLQGLIDHTTSSAKTIVRFPEIPLIAYLSLFLTLHKEPILNSIEEDFTYANCLTLYNETSKDLLTFWKTGDTSELYEKNTLLLCSLATVTILIGCVGIASSSFFKKEKPPTVDASNSPTKFDRRYLTPSHLRQGELFFEEELEGPAAQNLRPIIYPTPRRNPKPPQITSTAVPQAPPPSVSVYSSDDLCLPPTNKPRSNNPLDQRTNPEEFLINGDKYLSYSRTHYKKLPQPIED